MPKSTHERSIVDWLLDLRAWARQCPVSEPLNIGGIDATDILLTPLYLAILNATRSGAPKAESISSGLVSELYTKGYRVKMAMLERKAVWRSGRAEPTDVLLWSRDVTHTTMLQPVAAALRKEGVRCSLLACQPKVFHRLQQRDPSAIFTMAAWPDRVRLARQDGMRRAKLLDAVADWQLPAFPHPAADLVESAVRRTILNLIGNACEAVTNIEAALDTLRPKLLVVGNDLTMEGRAGTRVAAARGIPTGVFMHGSISADVLQSHHIADHLVVFGEVHRQELVQHHGLQEDQVSVCGAPNLDQRPQQTGLVHPMLSKRLGIRPDEPWILVATSGPGHRISHRHHQFVIQHLMRLSAALPDVPVVIKLHRKDRLAFYQEGLKNCGLTKLFVIAHDVYGFPQDIYDWLQGCRLVLTGASTVAMESMLMDVPVVTMDFCDEIHHVDFIDVGATTHVTTPESMEHAVRAILAGKGPRPDVLASAKAFLERSFHSLDGKSSRRGALALVDLMRAAPTEKPQTAESR